ncbi:YgjV family protein [Shewanella sp. 1CM18E]|uniref:YgjV family protein n=1 Tax=Shewanella sp. 1CM18E TaxID=2929169 RepID=UPI0020BE1589|nr:YgjV family protein [Shewanella sp. 1CM18E]
MFELSHQSLLWVQALGFVSMAVGWWANAQKNDQHLLSGNLVASGLTAMHLGLLGSNLGLFNQLLNMVRFAICRSRTTRAKRSSIYLPLVFASLAFLQGLLWANHWAEWCAVASAVLMSFALFYAKGAQLRIAMLISNLLNLALSIYLMSWSGIAYQVVTILILSYALLPLKSSGYAEKPAA